LVDALGGAPAIPSDESVADVLAEHASELRPWLRIVVTARPDAGLRHRLREFDRFDLLPDLPENRDDIRSFLQARLASPALAARSSNNNILLARLEEWVAGNFLSARLATNLL